MIVIFFFFLAYSFLIMRWVFSIKPKQKQQQTLQTQSKGITVLVAFRNEKENLCNLLTCFNAQDYPPHLTQYIFINDHSEDEGEKILEKSELWQNTTCKLLNLTGTSGKKAAIELGVKNAKNEIIVTTDADCSMGVRWLSCISQEFYTHQASLLIGPVKLEANQSFFEKLQAFEFSSLMAVTLGTTNSNRAILSNGANFSFLKSAFNKINPYQKNHTINTGDDVFLLHEFKKYSETRKGIYFISDKDALVTTKPKNKLNSFLEQRLRWASKSKNYKDLDTIFIGGLIFLINLIIILVLILTIVGSSSVLFFTFLFLLKWILDLILIQRVPVWLRGRSLFSLSLILSIIYPFYSIGIALLSLFYRPKWKGRKI